MHAFIKVFFYPNLTLKQRITSMMKGFDTLSDYLWNFKTICDELAIFGKPVSDMKSWQLLNGFGKDFEVFVVAMLRPPAHAYFEVVTLLESYADDQYKLDTPTS